MKVTSTLGRWILEKYGVYSPLSGVTSNQAEGFNCVLKRLQNWKEIPIDAAVLAFYHLQAFYVNETQRGFSGLRIKLYVELFQYSPGSALQVWAITTSARNTPVMLFLLKK